MIVVKSKYGSKSIMNGTIDKDAMIATDQDGNQDEISGWIEIPDGSGIY